jgi:hypothetical protein
MGKVPAGFRGYRVTGGPSEAAELKAWRKYQEERLEFGFSRTGMRKRDYLAGYRAGYEHLTGASSLGKLTALAKTVPYLQKRFTNLQAEKLQAERELVEARRVIARLLEMENPHE